MDNFLDSKIVFVSGAGSGIGRALALEFARHGARVACCGRRRERLDETVQLISDEGGEAMAAPADITDEPGVLRALEAVREEWGDVEILFNNAGSFNSIAGVHEADPQTWWRDVEVNLRGSFLLIRGVLPAMLARNSGVIINMNGGRPVGGSGYACGKAGLMELTRVLHEELKMQNSEVLVYSAGPGLVKTEMTELQADSEAGRHWIPSTAESFESGNLREPEDIARATMELLKIASPENSGKSYNPGTDFSEF
jgi:NAD(P)-dependent dehydrogenase (short-subunit alcohol dehydrogenase family)